MGNYRLLGRDGQLLAEIEYNESGLLLKEANDPKRNHQIDKMNPRDKSKVQLSYLLLKYILAVYDSGNTQPDEKEAKKILWNDENCKANKLTQVKNSIIDSFKEIGITNIFKNNSLIINNDYLLIPETEIKPEPGFICDNNNYYFTILAKDTDEVILKTKSKIDSDDLYTEDGKDITRDEITICL